jgi:hypothetical protein
VEECGPCPVFASFTLGFTLQLRKKHGKTSVRVRKTSFKEEPQSLYSLHITKTSTHYKTLTNTHITTPPPHTHTHTYTYLKKYKTTTAQIKTNCRTFANVLYKAPNKLFYVKCMSSVRNICVCSEYLRNTTRYPHRVPPCSPVFRCGGAIAVCSHPICFAGFILSVVEDQGIRGEGG